uniref:Uncharacterized protein n=1 Tax=Marseillevirus LCMAC103 TaxID=2506604 RepID=A0A481YVY8_9VIRU|nr:MAG: uncharacterized protein LCMAC103_04210 [Marseillevirus LCMAC103]
MATLVDRCLQMAEEKSSKTVGEIVAAVAGRSPRFRTLRATLAGKFKPGNLRVGGATLRPRKYAFCAGFQPIPVISLGAAPWKSLSPFFLGPVADAGNVENYWQFHKVWADVARQRQIKRPKNKPVRTIWVWPRETHVSASGEILPAYWRWRAAGFANAEPVRRPNGRQIPLFSLFRGKKLGLVEAREQVYIPAYRAAASRSPVFHRLLAKLRAGERLVLIDLDGPKLDLHPEGAVADPSRLQAWVARDADEKGRYFPYGHGYVLAALLLEYLGA